MNEERLTTLALLALIVVLAIAGAMLLGPRLAEVIHLPGLGR